MATHAILPPRLLLLRIAAGLIGMLIVFAAGEAFSASWKNPDKRLSAGAHYPDSYCRTTYKLDNGRAHGRHRGPGHYEIVREKIKSHTT